ncbi:MAG: hypothetical protein ACE5FR_05475 [Rhodospirillales bacterium]
MPWAIPATRTVFAALVIALWAHGGAAEVTPIEVLGRAPLAGGKAFGAAGAYERITGRLHYAVDPAHHASASMGAWRPGTATAGCAFPATSS